MYFPLHGRPCPCCRLSVGLAACWYLCGRSAAELAADSVLGPEQVITWQDGLLVPNISGSWLRLRGPIGTVCVTGDDRVGKSTMLTAWGRNVSNSEDFFFSVGHKRTTHTQGVWSAVLPTEVTGLDFHLNLCDSQGLKQVPELEQMRLFSANVLIPSVLVYMVINVVQNDQLRDLARMAHQFLQLSSDEFGRFGQVLSPHLLVVVREESDLDGEAIGAERNLSDHLEAALSGPGYTEEKDLVRQVFKTREAFSLHELPRIARRVLRDAASEGSMPPHATLASQGAADEALPWRRSGEVVLMHVLQALRSRQHAFPQGGPEFVEWYRSVLETVNSQERGSMGRLVGLTEQILSSNLRRSLLEQWRKPIHLTFALVALLVGFGGFLGRWLDRVAWCVWVALCVCYVGTSPLVTTPLHGIVPSLCEKLVADTSVMLVKVIFSNGVCREFTSQSIASLLAMILGVLTYPLLTRQFRLILGFLPLPQRLKQSGATLLLSAAFAALGILGEIDVSDSLDADTWASFGARGVLVLSMAISAVEFSSASRSNYARRTESARGRELHFYVSARVSEVRALESSKDWQANIDPCNALWRYRLTPALWQVPLLLQAGVLLVWAYMIRPHCDAVLSAGVGINFFYLLWRLGRTTFRSLHKCLQQDGVDIWWNSLPDAGADSNGDSLAASGMDPGSAAPGSAEDHAQSPEPEQLDETPEEESSRRDIEKMRESQEPHQSSKWTLLRLFCWVSALSACVVELLRRAGYSW